MKVNKEYARTTFVHAVGMMTGPEEFRERVAAAWSHIALLQNSFEFGSEAAHADFDWLMTKRSQFGVGDRMKAKATDAECDEVRSRILRIYGFLSEC